MATNSAPLSATDPHSYTNSDRVITTHIDINLRCDFQRKILFGFVTLDVELIEDSNELLLDANALAIEKVTDLETGNALLWTVPDHHPSFGYCLRVPLPINKRVKGSTAKIQIRYSTTPESAGIQWFEPHQTEGKKHPYVYTQLEAISARTFVPCQDSPSVKAPYTIKVSVPSPLVVACSGLPVREDPLFEDDGWLTYEYKQPVPIPAYLIALAAGDQILRGQLELILWLIALKKAAIGPRSSVWTEKELLEACVHEYSEVTEKFLQAAEKNFGVPYQWGKYDILVLPSAFPYAGMENPNLTFLNKCLLAGDRSMCNVLAHEISHSWCGNLVTNASWNNFWINEWFTVYSERLLLGELYGEEYRHFEALIGYNDLIKTVNDFGATHSYTKLVPDLNGIHPDDVFSKIPLEKGFLFTYYLETLFGKDRVLRFANYYFNTFKYKNVHAELVKEHIIKYFSEIEPVAEEVLKQIDWTDWFYTPGLPKFDPRTVLSKSVASVCIALADKWIEHHGEGATGDDLKDFRATQTMYFLDQLLTRAVPMKHEVLYKLGELYQLSASTNVEIKFRWILLSLKSKDASIIPVAADFLSKQGRGLYVLPMYRALNELDHARAVEIYRANRSFYHNILTSRLDASIDITNQRH